MQLKSNRKEIPVEPNGRKNGSRDPDIQSSESANPRVVYADIIDLPRPEYRHPRMSPDKRAAQFAPFATLSGYCEMVEEAIRETEVPEQREMEDYEAVGLNQKFSLIRTLTEAGEHPAVRITCYEPDPEKEGGRYVTITDHVKRVDEANHRIELMSTDGVMNRWIRTDRICAAEVL